MSCDWVRNVLSMLLYGELSFEEEEAVHQHLEGCENCRAALDREKGLHRALDEAEAAAPPDLLLECRRSLRQRMGQRAAQRGLIRRLWDWTGQPVPPILWKPAGALALVALGFFAARLTAPETPARPPESGPVTAPVSFLEPEIQHLLLAAARDSSDASLRLDSMDILRKQTASPDVRQTLVRAVRSDPSSGVRLKALEGLKPYAGDPEVQSALAKVVLSDDNPGVRTQAIDLLVQHKDVAIVGTLQELLATEQDDYIRERCQSALRAMKASVATF